MAAGAYRVGHLGPTDLILSVFLVHTVENAGYPLVHTLSYRIVSHWHVRDPSTISSQRANGILMPPVRGQYRTAEH